MKQVNLSLRSKLIGLVLAVVTLLGIGTVFNLNQFEKDYKKRIRDQMATVAVKLGKGITAQLWERYSDVQAFAVNRSVMSFNKEAITGDFDNYVKLYSIYDLILVIDKNGRLVSSNSVDVNGKKVNFEKLQALDFSKEPWFENALKGQFTEDEKNNYKGSYVESYILNKTIGEAFGEPQFGSIFSTQIKDLKGEVIGVVANHVGSRWLESEIADQHSQMVAEEMNHSEVMLFNGAGKVMIHSDVVEGTKNIDFEKDQSVLLNQDFDHYHHGLGDFVKAESTDFKEMEHEGKGLIDLVAFHKIENFKSLNALGWTVVVEDTAEDAYSVTAKAKMQSYVILIVMSFFGVLLAVWAGIIISKSVAKVTATLAVNSEEVADASNKIASSSTQLSETAIQQAAALQETVAAVDEISAMVDRNAESAQKSKDVSQHSREAANRGRETVSNMILAIQEIDRSNDEINQQMDDSNRQLQEITKLINDISNKTTVINEIVFQTKLLSFNASVEAARAGEAGKGFAVVAEEVGNLAQMSGNAAKEISALLEQSVQKVHAIVSESKEKVDRLMLTSKEKVTRGSSTAQECNNSLDEIISQIQTVDSLVSEIAVASQEQSTGIREVSRAMGQMEQATQQNSAVASATSAAGEQIRSQSEILSSLVKDLSFIVTGQAHGMVAAHAPVKKASAPVAKADFKAPVKAAEKAPLTPVNEAPKKVGNILKLVTGKKAKTAEAPVTAPVESPAMKTTKPQPTKKAFAKQTVKAPVVEKVAMASGADYVPSGDDPGFSE